MFLTTNHDIPINVDVKTFERKNLDLDCDQLSQQTFRKNKSAFLHDQLSQIVSSKIWPGIIYKKVISGSNFIRDIRYRSLA